MKKTNKEHMTGINKILDKIDRLHDRINKLKKLWIKSRHPLKIGDEVIVNCGYSFEGKKMKVTDIWIHKSVFWNSHEWVWKAKGHVLKKDGSPGQRIGNWEERIT